MRISAVRIMVFAFMMAIVGKGFIILTLTVGA